jgi:flagellar basal body-associated protein FliL
MTNPLLHVIVLIAAIVIPGGLIVYFAWVARTRQKTKPRTSPEEAQNAFKAMYPPESLRVRERRVRLARARVYRRRKSEN